MTVTIAELDAELRRLGWPETTERSSDAIAWSVVDSVGVRHTIAAWWGSESHRVEDPITHEFKVVPTGREGIFVTGRGTVLTTLADAVNALHVVINQQYDAELLKMFGLRRAYDLPGAPVFPMGTVLTEHAARHWLITNGYP
jgi:hypothetical protein